MTCGLSAVSSLFEGFAMDEVAMSRVVTLIAAAGLAIATTGCTSRSQFEGDWVCENPRNDALSAFRISQDRAYQVLHFEAGGEAPSAAHQVVVPFKRSRADVLEADGSLPARSTNAIVADTPTTSSATLERKEEQLHVTFTSIQGIEIPEPRLSWACKRMDTAIIDEVQSSVALVDQNRPRMQELLNDSDFIACLRIDPSKGDRCAVAKRGACAAFSEGGGSLESSIMALAFGTNSMLARICTGNTLHLPPLGFTADATDNQFSQKLDRAFHADVGLDSEGQHVADASLTSPPASVGSTSAQAQETSRVAVDSQSELQQARVMPQSGQTHAVEGGVDGAGLNSTGSTGEGRSLFALEQVLRRGSSTESEWLGAMERLTSQDGGLASYRGMRVKEIFPPVFDRSTSKLLSFQLAFESRSYDMEEVRDAFRDQCGEMWEVTDVSSRSSSPNATCAVLYDPRVERVIAVVAKPSVQGSSATSSASGASDASSGWRVATISDPDGFTNVRSSPNGSAQIIGRVVEGQRFKVEPSTGDWWKVEVEGVGEGYMHRSRIELDRSGNN